MNVPSELIAAWGAEEQVPFSGWDFSHLSGRMVEELPPWSYTERASELLRNAEGALDIGTGGGERLLEMRASWPRLVVAIEDYPPNVLLSAQRLAANSAVSFVSAYTLNRKWITSPSCTTYSLPSVRSAPACRAAASLP